MKKIIISIICCAMWMPFAMSQNETDVLRLSQYYATGTARSIGMSGAFGALGGDLSVLSTNPAGLGLYRGSEFAFTPAFNFSKTDALFEQTTFKEKNFRFNINNAGYVYTWNFYRPKGLQSLSFGLAYNRLSDFSADAYVDARVKSSQLDEFADNASAGNISPMYEDLAISTLTIWDDTGNGNYINDYMLNGRYGQRLVRSIGYRGGIGEYDISLGANFSDMLYLGFTWGIHDVYYEEFYTHEEMPHFAQYLDSYIFNSDYIINGWGMNAKIGLLFRPFNMLRLGVAVHTPTAYWLTGQLATDMDALYTEPPPGTGTTDNYYWAESPIQEEDFKVTTPWRYNVSAAVVLGYVGLISLEAEYVDYSTNDMLPNKDYNDVNQTISEIYQGAFNLKAGAEVHFGPVFLRGGAAYYGSPYKDSYYEGTEIKNKPTLSYSGGIGFRTRNFYMDAAYSYTKFPQYYYDMYYNPAEHSYVSPILQRQNNKVVLTFGFKF